MILSFELVHGFVFDCKFSKLQRNCLALLVGNEDSLPENAQYDSYYIPLNVFKASFYNYVRYDSLTT